MRLLTSSEHPNAVLQNALGNRLMTVFQFDVFQSLRTSRHRQVLIRRSDSERELFNDDIAHT